VSARAEERIRRLVAAGRITPLGRRRHDRLDVYFDQIARQFDPVPTRRHR